MTMTADGQRTANPSAIWRIINGYSAYGTVVAAIELGVFDALAHGPTDASALADQGGFVPARVQPLLDALVALDLLDRDADDRYLLTVDSERFLVCDAPRTMRELVVHSPGPRENWELLAGTVRGGRVPSPVGPEFYRALVRATAPTQHAAAVALAPTLSPYSRVLDVGAGAAPWAIALLEHEPNATATINDLPGVAEIGSNAVRERGLASRVDVVECDYHAADFAPAGYDVVVLGHVLRSEPREEVPKLVDRVSAALRPGGTIVVADYFVDDDRRGPINALLLGVTMAASVPDAATYTEAEFRGWLTDAGLVDVERRAPVPFQAVLVARKPGEPTD
jgi:SAM-dependent methyltransferase